MKKLIVTTFGVLGGMLVSASCFAHTGHTTAASFAEGFLHPLTGMDHLIALMLMGVFAALMSDKHAIKLVSFILIALFTGFGVGVLWTQATNAEILVGASMVVLPLCLLACRINGLMKTLAIAAMGLFSVSHGLVQGSEAQGMLLQYGMGTMLSSLSVLVLTMVVTKLINATVASLKVVH